MEVQLFEDLVYDGIELYGQTHYFQASQIDEISLCSNQFVTIIHNLSGINCQSWGACRTPPPCLNGIYKSLI